jgi:hypothetical protein
MAEDIETLYAEAIAVPGGALPRGPERFYVEVQPERIRGFVDIATHPWFVAVSESVLGPDYRIVEIGFDIPFPGAADQPWHRDFAVPEATSKGRRLNSLAFNLTAVDTRPEMGPFEIALGTQWDQFPGPPAGMFPDKSLWPRYEARKVVKMPQRGDISARSALTITAAPPIGRTGRDRCWWSESMRRTPPTRLITTCRSRALMPRHCRPMCSTTSLTGWWISLRQSCNTMSLRDCSSRFTRAGCALFLIASLLLATAALPASAQAPSAVQKRQVGTATLGKRAADPGRCLRCCTALSELSRRLLRRLAARRFDTDHDSFRRHQSTSPSGSTGL